LTQDPVRYRRYLVSALEIIAFFGMAVGADLTLVGKDVVRLVLGPQWSESGRIFELFGPGIGIMLVYSTVGWIHVSIGKPGRWLRWTLVETAATALLFVVALPWGPAGIAVAWSFSYWTLLIPAFWYAGRPVGFGVSALIGAFWRYAAASLVAGLATAAIARGTLARPSPVSAVTALESIIIGSALFGTLYVATVILLHWGCAPLHQLARVLREIAPERRATTPATEPL
jgi:PST family polysaccharide transporter